jgi:enoyl-CoA hydratase/carnithine racemase
MPSAAAYDSGLSGDEARPGSPLAPEFDADFAFQFAMRFPMIAAVNGACAGVGLALALFCDLRFGAASRQAHHRRAEAGAARRVRHELAAASRLVGVTRAADLLLSGRVFTPAETIEWGIWNGVEADGEATLAAAQQYALHLATGVGPQALATTKAQLYRDLLHHSPAAAIRDAQQLLERAMTTAEYREGVAALRAKRPPQFP